MCLTKSQKRHIRRTLACLKKKFIKSRVLDAIAENIVCTFSYQEGYNIMLAKSAYLTSYRKAMKFLNLRQHPTFFKTCCAL